MSKKIILSFLIIVFMFVNLFIVTTYAENVTVTKENLKSTLEKFIASEANSNNYKINVTDTTIVITYNNQNYTLNYSLSNNANFSIEIPIEKGMSYNEFTKQIDKTLLPMIGYVAIADIQGVNFKTAMMYFGMEYLKAKATIQDPYKIFDDTALDNGITVDENDLDPNTICVSEFGERVMEYTDALFANNQVIKDTIDGVNSFELVIAKKDETEDSCKLISTLKVNTNANFSKISELMGDDPILNPDIEITKDNADYKVVLKVGQKCKIKADDQYHGYNLAIGNDCITIDADNLEITANNVGFASGYLTIGEEEKSIYITVEENVGNISLEPITLDISSKGSSEGNISNQPDVGPIIQEQPTKAPNTNNSGEKLPEVLPQTGTKNIIYISISFSVVLTIILGIKLKKYKDVK